MIEMPFQFVIGLGSNLGNRVENILIAKERLDKKFGLISFSSFYQSDAIEYTDQPPFINAVAEFQLPLLNAKEALHIMLEIEQEMGRERNIPKGPRTIDLDLLFYGTSQLNETGLKVPHPEWNKRPFVFEPLCELFPELKKYYSSPPNNCHCKIFQRIEDGVSAH